MPKRDDFTQSTKNLLASRVGYRCSNTKCRLQTSGPSLVELEAVNLGVAAHISAASVGGPRFSTALTPQQRASHANGIWLCQTCSKLIDSDVTRFTVEVLNDWKVTAEHLAASENQRYLTDNQRGEPIFVAVDDWETWIDKGSISRPGFFVLSYFGAGDVVYSCKIRLQNRSTIGQLLINPKVELVADEVVLESVGANVTQLRDIELPAGKWVTIGIHNGFNGRENFNRADSVWFRCKIVGQETGLSVKIATLSGSPMSL